MSSICVCHSLSIHLHLSLLSLAACNSLFHGLLLCLFAWSSALQFLAVYLCGYSSLSKGSQCVHYPITSLKREHGHIINDPEYNVLSWFTSLFNYNPISFPSKPSSASPPPLTLLSSPLSLCYSPLLSSIALTPQCQHF